jgi:hypothetical protein
MSRYVIKRLRRDRWLWQLMKRDKILLTNWYFPTKKQCIDDINFVEAEMKKAKGIFADK